MSYETTLAANESAILNTHRISRRTFLRNIGIGLALAVPLAACAPAAAPAASPAQSSAGEAAAPAAVESTSLEFWHQFSGERQTSLRQVLDALQETNPAIQIEDVSVPSNNEYRRLVLTAYAAGTAPDLLLLNPVPDGIDFFMKDILDPLDELMEAVGLELGDFLDPVLTANRASLDLGMPYGDKLTGIPLTVAPVAALFNKEHVLHAGLEADSPPETLDELIEWALRLIDDSGELEPRSGFILGKQGYMPSLVFSILGAQWNREGEENPEIPAADWVRNALYEHRISKLDIPDPIDLFRQQQGSILWTNTFRLADLEREIAEDFDLFTAKVPVIGSEFATTGYMQSLSLSKTSKYLDAGAQVIKFLSDEFFNILTDWPALPPRSSQLEKLDRNRELWDPFVNSLLEMGHNQFVGRIVSDRLFTDEFDKIWAEDTDVSATVAIKEWNNKFSRNAQDTQGNSYQGLPTAATFQPIKFTHSSFPKPSPLSDRQIADFVIAGCCYLCWPDWCCPSCVDA